MICASCGVTRSTAKRSRFSTGSRRKRWRLGLYLKLGELDGNGEVRLDRPLPKGYTEADVELLRRDLKFEVFTPKLTETHAAAIRRAGFELEHAREMWS